jgi:pimeloyl-ACP methyl ester carboxylesterase
MATFVLVHGSWHAGAAWQPTIQHLEGRGHKAFAPTMAGHAREARKNVNHAQCTKSVVDYIVDNSLSDIVLLGHSFAGTIISKVAESVPERIRRLLFLNAFVLQDGTSLIDEVPRFYVDLFDRLVQASDDTVMLPFPIWREAFINDGDLKLAQWACSQLSPEPYELGWGFAGWCKCQEATK